MVEGMDSKFYRFLDKNKPIDNAILELIKEDILKVNFIHVKSEKNNHLKNYSQNILPAKIKHTS